MEKYCLVRASEPRAHKTPNSYSGAREDLGLAIDCLFTVSVLPGALGNSTMHQKELRR